MTDPDYAQRQETAAVVLYWMQRRGLTRKIFADRMGKSLSWVDKIRAGDRQLDRLSVLRQIASVLEFLSPYWLILRKPNANVGVPMTGRSMPSALHCVGMMPSPMSSDRTAMCCRSRI